MLLVVGLLACCALVLPAVVLVSAAADCDVLGLAPSELAAEEIPAEYLALYQNAGADTGVAWPVLAAIGSIETRHGMLDAEGVRDGANEAGAAGPMQFGIGGRAGNTWGGDPVREVPPHLPYGVDGNGDGVADVYDPADAIPAAAGYLLAHGAPDDLRGALLAYNDADWYVDRVLDEAVEYAAGAVVVPDTVALQTVACQPHAGAYPAGEAAGSWGGHENGRIPLEELCSIGGNHLLRCDAAAAFNAMNAAHFVERGYRIPVTDSYRDYADQADLRARKPHLAAPAGQSSHGWGLALDIDAGGWNGQVFRWLQTNAHHYGWHHPPWARIDASKPEPWHWEYGANQVALLASPTGRA